MFENARLDSLRSFPTEELAVADARAFAEKLGVILISY